MKKKTTTVGAAVLFGSSLTLGCAVHGSAAVEAPPPPQVVVQAQVEAPPPPQAQAEIVVVGEPPAPPPPQTEVVPASPGVEFFWVAGHHRWDGRHYIWVAGRYERRPHPAAQWRPARWEARGATHVWVEGTWETAAVAPPPAPVAPPPPVVQPPPPVVEEIVVQGAAPPPPAVQVEVVPASPGAEFFWVRGYHRWDGHHYVWVPGRYERRPHANAHWKPARWETRGHGHVWVEGSWDVGAATPAVVATPAVAVVAATPAPAPAPGAAHPWYLRALSDLRDARANLERKGGDKQMKWDEHDAILAIDGAIKDIKEAAVDDGKNLEDHPPVDARETRGGRLHKALAALRTARQDIEKEEDNGFARGLRARALHDIDEAIHFAEAGVTAAAQAS